jgi:hypothetical protein
VSGGGPSVALGRFEHLVSARQLEARERRGRLSTGLAALDRALAGGWPRAALSELAGARSSGRTAVLLASLAEALRRGEAVALIDVGGGLDPRAARRAGIPLPRLLWVRCSRERGAAKALSAAEVALGAGGFGLVVVDLGDEPPRVPTAAWLRLKRGAEKHGSVVLASSGGRAPGALGACAVTLERGRPRFEGGGQGAPVLLLGVEARATLHRGGAAANDTHPELRLAHAPGRETGW